MVVCRVPVTLLLLLLLLVVVAAWPMLACWSDYVKQAAHQADVAVMGKVVHLRSSRDHGFKKFYNLVKYK